MELMEKRIAEQGRVLPGDILKVDSFLNHQIDVPLLSAAGEEFYNAYRACKVNKILTIEASGIGIACLTARFFDCPVVFAKKKVGRNSDDEFFTSSCFSYTKMQTCEISVSKRYLSPEDRILLIDDFLAEGNALAALIDLANQAGAQVVGCGIVVEKAYQSGGERIRGMGYRVESLARIRSMSPEGGIVFCS
ncbi:MAG: xanthine phosphoribosyltransferase [Clostridia bacterium]|nr:xanthine phosphoribosyltransferase [Clostridia bacterium]